MKQDWKDHLKTLSERHEKAVPDAIWDQVKLHLPQKSKKRFLWLWWCVLGGTLLISAWYFTDLYTEGPAITKESNVSVQSNKAQENIESIKKADDLQQAGQAMNTQTQNTSILQSGLTNHASSILVQNEKAVKFQKHTNKTDQGSKTTEKQDNIRAKVIENTASAAPQISSLESDEYFQEKGFIRMIGLAVLPLPFELIYQQQTTKPETSELYTGNSGIKCYQFHKSNANWGIEIYAGPAYSPFQLHDKQGDLKAYQEKREATESVRTGLTAGVRGVFSKGHWSVKLGLEYLLMYEQLQSNSRETRITSVYRDGKLLYIDTINGFRLIKNHNYHHQFNIPLMLNYHWKWKNLEFGLQPGVGLNLWSSHQGKILNEFSEPMAFENVGGIRLFDRKIIPYFSFHVSASGRITDQWKWFVEPGIHYYLKPFNADAYPFDQKYQSFQARVGFRKNF
ncbi:MAG: hypothetical protein IPM34_01325 [Saprospiraceae bacterium]|nr:hypothetical protein [Saprospiraceae bacterium]